MTPLCAGLAVLGLCIPVPGHTLASVEAAGWMVNREDRPSWFASQTLASGTFRLAVLVSGTQELVTSVLLTELRPEDQANDESPLDLALKQACARERSTEICTIGGLQLRRHACASGWLLLPVGVDTEKSRAHCARWAPLFDHAINRK
jgi:hypothetical protein